MASMTPDQIAAKWAQNLGAASESIKAGIAAVTVAPGLAASRQKQVWVQNTTSSADKWATRTAAVPLATWQQAATDKGVPRIATGATAAQPKFTAFLGQLLPAIDRVKGSLPPRGNLDQNIARMTAFVRGMSQFTYNKQG